MASRIERSFHTLDGEDADPSHAKQNERFVVVLTVTEPQPQFARVALIDYVPAGFEIDNPHLVSSGDTGTLDWIENAGTPSHHRVPRRPLHRGVRAAERRSSPSSRSPMSCARCRPEAMCCRRRWSRTCIVPTASAAPEPETVTVAPRNERNSQPPLDDGAHRAGERGRLARPSSVSTGRAGAGPARPSLRSALVWIAAAIAGGIAGLFQAFGPPPLGRDLEVSTIVVDRDGKLLRAYLTSEGRWRLPATREDVDPRFLDALLAYEDKRFCAPSRRRSARPRCARPTSSLTQGHIVSGGSTITMQVARLIEPRAERSLYAKLQRGGARASARMGAVARTRSSRSI